MPPRWNRAGGFAHQTYGTSYKTTFGLMTVRIGSETMSCLIVKPDECHDLQINEDLASILRLQKSIA